MCPRSTLEAKTGICFHFFPAARRTAATRSVTYIHIHTYIHTYIHKREQLLTFIFLSFNVCTYVGMVGKDDLIRELKQCGNLQNILRNEQDSSDDLTSMVSLEDFELLAVLGRGGYYTYIHTYIHMCIHKYTYIHMCIHIYTYIHTYIQVR